MTITSTMAVFAVIISLGGTETTSVGPFDSMRACTEMQQEIETDIARSFPSYGMVGDMWNAGGGAIMRISDYEISCERQVRDVLSGEIVSTMRFN